MSGVSTATIEILQYMLPGFLCAWIFYSFTSHQKPQQIEQLVQALIFTLIIQVLVIFFKFTIDSFFTGTNWSEDRELVLSTVMAMLMGFIFSAFANNDLFHKLIRLLRISTETSYPSEWYGELSSQKHFVILHLAGERRIYGWPKEWPSSPDTGHFSIIMGEWLVNDSEQQPSVTQSDIILIKASDVEMVEFIKPTLES